MLRVIGGAVGGFIFGAVATGGLLFTLGDRRVDNETWILVAAIGGGALSGPSAVIAATWTLLNAMRAMARGHVEG